MRAEPTSRRVAVAAVLAATAAVAFAVPAGADDPDDSGDGTTPTVIDGAVLRWGINEESSNRAFAPDTYNFFSAGIIPDPGEGGTTLPRSQWRQAVGDVAIQKWHGDRWRAATWAGLSTDSDGEPLGSPSAGTFSNHRIALGGGTGEVDAGAGTAHVEWDGDWTVLYYSGMSFFHVSDPALDVADGVGTLTATVRGYASSAGDPDSWEPVDPAVVTLADLPAVELGDDDGLTAEPAYLGVEVTGVDQAQGGEHFGSFPQSYVDYMDRLGTAPFWFSSGAVTDAFKVPLPLTVAYDASAEPPGPTPTQQPTVPPIENPTVPPPGTTAPVPAATVTVPAAAAAPPSAPPPDAAVAAPAAVLPPATALDAELVTVAAPADPATPSPWWWAGGGLLLGAALVLLVPSRSARSPRAPGGPTSTDAGASPREEA